MYSETLGDGRCSCPPVVGQDGKDPRGRLHRPQQHACACWTVPVLSGRRHRGVRGVERDVVSDRVVRAAVDKDPAKDVGVIVKDVRVDRRFRRPVVEVEPPRDVRRVQLNFPARSVDGPGVALKT